MPSNVRRLASSGTLGLLQPQVIYPRVPYIAFFRLQAAASWHLPELATGQSISIVNYRRTDAILASRSRCQYSIGAPVVHNANTKHQDVGSSE